MTVKFEFQNPTHNEKRLRCECGSWNWKVQMEPWITRALYVCAECGDSASPDAVNDMIRKEHEGRAV